MTMSKREFAYTGAGFPVLLLDFPFRKVGDEEILDVDPEKLDLTIALLVLRKPAPLTGREIRFLRIFLGLSMGAFGKEFGRSAPGIKKWEDLGDETLRSVETDYAIRNLLAGKLSDQLRQQVQFAIHKSILDASKYWPLAHTLQIPYPAMKEVVRQAA